MKTISDASYNAGRYAPKSLKTMIYLRSAMIGDFTISRLCGGTCAAAPDTLRYRTKDFFAHRPRIAGVFMQAEGNS